MDAPFPGTDSTTSVPFFFFFFPSLCSSPAPGYCFSTEPLARAFGPFSLSAGTIYLFHTPQLPPVSPPPFPASLCLFPLALRGHHAALQQSAMIVPPLTERSLCLFAAFLANQGLQASSIMAYLSAVRHLQISAGLPSPTTNSWPWPHYVSRGTKRSQNQPQRVRLPITTSILKQLHGVWFSNNYGLPVYKAKLLGQWRPPHFSASLDLGSYCHPRAAPYPRSFYQTWLQIPA